LAVWAKRLGVEVVEQGAGADPAAVAFDALKAAQSRGIDLLICDTAGRLHNKTNLMEELKKISRVLAKALPGAPHETLLIIDAVTGQNGFVQAEQFHKELNLTGVIVSKLDGTAKAGIVVSIEKELQIPVKFVGVGESVDDLALFSPEEFVSELLRESR
jgi:fused signal recognition particle receptor